MNNINTVPNIFPNNICIDGIFVAIQIDKSLNAQSKATAIENSTNNYYASLYALSSLYDVDLIWDDFGFDYIPEPGSDKQSFFDLADRTGKEEQ